MKRFDPLGSQRRGQWGGECARVLPWPTGAPPGGGVRGRPAEATPRPTWTRLSEHPRGCGCPRPCLKPLSIRRRFFDSNQGSEQTFSGVRSAASKPHSCFTARNLNASPKFGGQRWHAMGEARKQPEGRVSEVHAATASRATGFTGRSRTNVAPRPSPSLCAMSVPPSSRAAKAPLCRPKPCPFFRVVKP